jgi:hypothetical protein
MMIGIRQHSNSSLNVLHVANKLIGAEKTVSRAVGFGLGIQPFLRKNESRFVPSTSWMETTKTGSSCKICINVLRCLSPQRGYDMATTSAVDLTRRE